MTSGRLDRKTQISVAIIGAIALIIAAAIQLTPHFFPQDVNNNCGKMKKERKVLLERLAHIQEKLKQEVKNDLVADSITTIAQIANINLKIEEECD